MSSPDSSLCPDLDFSDCLSAPTSPSPRPRRPRGAPWASKRPRPYVDRVEICTQDDIQALESTSSDKADHDETPTNDDQPSPQKRRASTPTTIQRGAADRCVQAKEDDNLIRLLFPELPTASVGDAASLSTTSRDPRDTISATAEYISKGTGSGNDGPCESSMVAAGHFPVTPSRGSRWKDELHPNPTGEINISPTSVSTTHPICKSKYTYSTRRRNRTALRSATVRHFQRITGVTTNSRVQAATSRSNNDCSGNETSEVDEVITSGQEGIETSPSQTGPEPGVQYFGLGATPDELFITGRSESAHKVLSASHQHVNREIDSSESPATRQQMPQTRTSARLVRQRAHCLPRSAAACTNLKLARSQGTEQTILTQPQSMPPSKLALEAKHEKYREYVYKRILEYPHAREDDELRPGYKALEMGYLVPRPGSGSHIQLSDYRTRECPSIREIGLKILGRLSQTDFEILREMAAKARQATSKTAKSGRHRTKVPEQDGNDSDTTGERRKPLSRLNAGIIVANSTVGKAADPHQRQETNSRQEPYTKLTHTKNDRKSKSKKTAKKEHLLPGHRRLNLQYTHLATCKGKTKKVEEDVGISLRDNVDLAAVRGSMVPQAKAPPVPDAASHSNPLPDAKYSAHEHTSRTAEPISPVTARLPSPPPAVAPLCNNSAPSYLEPERRPVSAPTCSRIDAVHGLAGTPRRQGTEQDGPSFCDALMPMSTQMNQTRPANHFTLCTTNTTRPVYTAIQMSGPSSLSREADVPRRSFTSALRNTSMDLGNRENDKTAGTKRKSTPIEGKGDTNRRLILATKSSSVSDQEAEFRRFQFHRPVTQQNLQFRDEELNASCGSSPTSTLSPSQSTTSDVEDSYLDHADEYFYEEMRSTLQDIGFYTSKEYYWGPTAPLVEEELSGMLLGGYPPALDLPGQPDEIPCPYQPCYTPSSEYWWEESYVEQTVPSDIEARDDRHHDQRYTLRPAMPPEEVPPLPPAPDTPQELSSGIDTTVETKTKIGAYGRRVIELPPLYTTHRMRIAKRSIPQDTLQ